MQPKETYEEAEALLVAANSEAAYRTVASRSYFAAFQHAVRHPALQDFKLASTGEDHRGLLEFLKSSSDPNLRRLGFRCFAQLRGLRNRADYEIEVPFTKGLAEEAFDLATEAFFTYLPPVD